MTLIENALNKPKILVGSKTPSTAAERKQNYI